MKKKVLFVVDEREMGGVSVVLNDLLHFLNKEILDIDVLVLHNRGNMLSELADDIHMFFGTSYFDTVDYHISEVLKMYNLQKLYRKLRIVFDLKTKRVKKRIVKERKKIIKKNYDVEIAFKDGYSAIFTACGDTVKKIHWLHCDYASNNPNEKYAKLFADLLPRFDHIVGVSTNVAKSFNETYHLKQKAEVIPIAMDTKRILALSKAESKVSLNKQKLNIVVVGRAHPVKGYERMVAVFDKLQQAKLMENVEVHVFGDGPLFADIVELIKAKKLTDKIVMEGNTENPYAEIKMYDVLLLPSYSEAFGTVISEAFIVGVPVLGTRTAASEMSIRQNQNGWICENSESGLYQALKKLIHAPQEIKHCKQHLQSFQYDNYKILKRIEEMLQDE
ncbi:MAG: glycosyltransferase [Breznakia sp.]